MSDDFFSNVSVRPPPAHSPSLDQDDFAHAISLRFGSADLRTARLLPGDIPNNNQHPSTSNPSHPSLSPHPPPPPQPQQSFTSVHPSALAHYLADPHALILDIRPHAAHAAARINNAISLSVPTTLLKRPLFSLSKLSQMLPSPSSRAYFADWSSASHILVYDSDSTSAPDNGILAGLLRKFRAEGFAGELAWVRGGFQAVWKEAREFATTELLPPEEDDPDPASSSGTLRTTHLPKAAFSLFSTTAALPPQFAPFPVSHALPNTPAPSASRVANPFFDTIRQNVELSHGITERIPLRLPRRVRRRIHDLPFRWLQDIARRSATRHSSRHPGLDSLESGSESSDDPHTSDPDENDPNVEEGTEAFAMQFYRIELAEQRRLRSIMEHHTRESEVSAFAPSAKPRRMFNKDIASVSADRGQGDLSVQTGAKSVPGTPHVTPFPYSITAGVEKGTKNRYTYIWPFEHARVRLHDGRHQGSHPGRRDKGRSSERGRGSRDRSRGKGKERGERDQEQDQDKQRRSRSSPVFGTSQDQEAKEAADGSSRYSFYFASRSSFSRTGLANPIPSPSPGVPRVKIEYDVTEQDSRMSGPPTPATVLPFLTPPFFTPPFFTPMETSPGPTPMRAWPPQLLSLPSNTNVSPGARLGGTQLVPSASGSPSFGPHPLFPLRLPNRPGGLFPSIGEQTWTSESLSSSAAPFGAYTNRMGDDTGTRHDPRSEPSSIDDYVNASYVQPLGTRKRYIATQGPLPSTYVDFWTLVWEQNVHVIVMLTREVENAMVKCGSYWTDTEYGPLRLVLLSTSPPMSPNAHATTTDIYNQGLFAIREPQGKASGATKDQPTLIIRTFTLSHTSYPGVPPRRITHLQYLDWSDMNVPDDPRGVLDLIKKVEQAAAESTPGPSPGGSLSPASVSSSVSDSQSPDIGSDQKGYDTLLSPTSAGAIPGRGRGRSEWRHLELDAKTGVAAFALGKAPPVLLHCSAGVGRTGGFIAVDAMLDGIRRELREKREERRLKKAARVCVVVSTESKVGVNDAEAREFGVESIEMGVNGVESSGEENVSDESNRMDIDEPAIDKAKTRDPLHLINTIPLHVSARDRTKGRKRHHRAKVEKQSSSSESLVVHVPYAGTDDALEGSKVADIDLGDPKEVGWQPSSTRKWVEQVSDQTHAHAEEGDLPPPPSLPDSTRERSPGSTSNSSGPSADDSVNRSASGSSGDRVERKSDMESASGAPPPSSVSKPGSGSISLSNFDSGAGTGSRFGSSLLRGLRDSSVTSISAESRDSLLAEHEPKLNAALLPSSVIHTSSSFDMDIDYPPRPVSAPLQPAHSSTVGLQRAVHSRHHKTLRSSPVASFSTPILVSGNTERDAAKGSASRSNLVLGSGELSTPPREFKSGESADAERSRKNSQILSDVSEEHAAHKKPGSNLRVNTDLSSLKVPETGSAKNPPLSSREGKGKGRATISPVPRIADASTSQQHPAAMGGFSSSEHDQRTAEHPIVDYKLPRELHRDLSPPLMSSLPEPICTVIQDMREQRMSLCQSLRQYVFVHAAVIEGALGIVDEERELWGHSGTSDDASSAEGEFGTSVKKSGRRTGYSEAKTWFEGTDEVGVAVMAPELEQGARSSRPGGGQVPLASTSASSGVSSPSKGKRGPSPTELLREDKTGALSMNKRPIIQRKARSDEADQFSFESRMSSPVAGENGGGSRSRGCECDPILTRTASSAGKGRPHDGQREVAICDSVL